MLLSNESFIAKGKIQRDATLILHKHRGTTCCITTEQQQKQTKKRNHTYLKKAPPPAALRPAVLMLASEFWIHCPFLKYNDVNFLERDRIVSTNTTNF